MSAVDKTSGRKRKEGDLRRSVLKRNVSKFLRTGSFPPSQIKRSDSMEVNPPSPNAEAIPCLPHPPLLKRSDSMVVTPPSPKPEAIPQATPKEIPLEAKAIPVHIYGRPDDLQVFNPIKKFVLAKSGEEMLILTLADIHGIIYLGICKFWRPPNGTDYKHTIHNIYMPLAAWANFLFHCLHDHIGAVLYQTTTRVYSLQVKCISTGHCKGICCMENGHYRKSLFFTPQYLPVVLRDIQTICWYVSIFRIHVSIFSFTQSLDSINSHAQ